MIRNEHKQDAEFLFKRLESGSEAHTLRGDRAGPLWHVAQNVAHVMSDRISDVALRPADPIERRSLAT